MENVRTPEREEYIRAAMDVTVFPARDVIATSAGNIDLPRVPFRNKD